MLFNKICLILVLLLFFTLSLRAEEVVVMTEEVPPMSFTDSSGNANGFAVEVVAEIVKRADLDIADDKVRILPWKRAYLMLEQGKNHLLFSTVRTPEREELFKWVGPIAPRKIWFFKLKSRKDISGESIEELKKYTIGAVPDFASTKYLEELGFTIDYCNTENLNFRKLFGERVDLITSLKLNAAYQAQLIDRRYDELEEVAVLDDRYEYFLAVNKETSDDIVTRLQNALDEMKRDGTYEKIFQRYLQ